MHIHIMSIINKGENMPCVTDISQSDQVQHFENLLCQACKFLTKDQIESLLNPGSGIYDGFEWYKQHLFLDYCYNSDLKEKQISLKELNRFGHSIVRINGGYELT